MVICAVYSSKYRVITYNFQQQQPNLQLRATLSVTGILVHSFIPCLVGIATQTLFNTRGQRFSGLTEALSVEEAQRSMLSDAHSDKNILMAVPALSTISIVTIFMKSSFQCDTVQTALCVYGTNTCRSIGLSWPLQPVVMINQ